MRESKKAEKGGGEEKTEQIVCLCDFELVSIPGEGAGESTQGAVNVICQTREGEGREGGACPLCFSMGTFLIVMSSHRCIGNFLGGWTATSPVLPKLFPISVLAVSEEEREFSLFAPRSVFTGLPSRYQDFE